MESGGTTEKIRLLIVDSREMVRRGIQSMLAGDETIDIIGEATTGRGAVRAIHRLRPDIVLLEARLGDTDGAEVCKAASRRFPDVAVVVLTSSPEDEIAHRSIELGAKAYIVKDISTLDLKRALRSVAEGQVVLDSRVTAGVIDRLKNEPGDSDDGWSEEELELLRLMAEGLTNNEIGVHLALSGHTIKDKVKQITDRLEARNRVEAVAIATRRGLI